MVGRAAIDVLLEEVRFGLDRVDPADLASEVAAGALVIDTRPIEQRQRDGELPGALIIDRNILEWRLDPSCPHHVAEADSANLRMIIVCDEGYSSSLAAGVAAPTRHRTRHRSRWRIPSLETILRSSPSRSGRKLTRLPLRSCPCACCGGGCHGELALVVVVVLCGGKY
jgi:hypothetical protein